MCGFPLSQYLRDQSWFCGRNARMSACLVSLNGGRFPYVNMLLSPWHLHSVCDELTVFLWTFFSFFLQKQALERVALGQGVSKACILMVIDTANVQSSPRKNGIQTSSPNSLLSKIFPRILVITITQVCSFNLLRRSLLMHSNNQPINSAIVARPWLTAAYLFENAESSRGSGPTLTHNTSSH